MSSVNEDDKLAQIQDTKMPATRYLKIIAFMILYDYGI